MKMIIPGPIIFPGSGRLSAMVTGLLSGIVLAVCAGTSAGQESPKANRPDDVLGSTAPPERGASEPNGAVKGGFRWTKTPVEFKDGPAILKGTIFIPEKSDLTGVVILGGSERGPRTRLKERLAEHLASAGVAALIYDSAGTGQSTGNALFQTRDARAVEAIAAVRCLRNQSRVLTNQVGILGISEGAIVTLLASAREESIAFAIPISGGFGVSMVELARYRIEVKSFTRGLELDDIQRALLLNEVLFALLAGPDFFEWRMIDMKAAHWSNEGWADLVDVVRTTRQAKSRMERQEKWDALRRTMKTFRSEPWFDLVVVDVDRFDRFMFNTVSTRSDAQPLTMSSLAAEEQQSAQGRYC